MATSQKARLEIARKHLEAWLAAELEVTTHQSYMPIKDFNRITNAARSFLIDTGY